MRSLKKKQELDKENIYLCQSFDSLRQVIQPFINSASSGEQRKGKAESDTPIINNASAEYELHVLRHSKAPNIFQETSKI